jgi:hypothetical protein
VKKIVFVFLFLASCLPTPVTPTPEPLDGGQDTAVNNIKDASDTDLGSTEEPDGAKSPCAKACSNLDKLGCPEGKNVNCYSVCAHVQTTNLITLDPVCLGNAKSIVEVKACGGVSCAQK